MNYLATFDIQKPHQLVWLIFGIQRFFLIKQFNLSIFLFQKLNIEDYNIKHHLLYQHYIMSTTMTHVQACNIFGILPEFISTVNEAILNNDVIRMINDDNNKIDPKTLIQARKMVLDAQKNPCLLIPTSLTPTVCNFGDKCRYKATNSCRYYHPTNMATPNLPSTVRQIQSEATTSTTVNEPHQSLFLNIVESFTPVGPPTKVCHYGKECNNAKCKFLHRYTTQNQLPNGGVSTVNVETYNVFW